MKNDIISRQDAIGTLDVGAELFRRVLDDTNIVGVEREKYEWGLGLIESYISDMKELPPAQQWIPTKDIERLPAYGEDVLLNDECLYVVGFLVGTTDGRLQWKVNGWYHDLESWKAWLPLPEPYKRGEEEE